MEKPWHGILHLNELFDDLWKTAQFVFLELPFLFALLLPLLLQLLGPLEALQAGQSGLEAAPGLLAPSLPLLFPFLHFPIRKR